MTPHFPFRSPLILLIGPSSFKPVQVWSNNSHTKFFKPKLLKPATSSSALDREHGYSNSFTLCRGCTLYPYVMFHFDASAWSARILKRPLIREDLNVIQNTSPKRLMPHLLHQMVQNRTNLGGHSIQMVIIINQSYHITPDHKPHGV